MKTELKLKIAQSSQEIDAVTNRYKQNLLNMGCDELEAINHSTHYKMGLLEAFKLVFNLIDEVKS